MKIIESVLKENFSPLVGYENTINATTLGLVPLLKSALKDKKCVSHFQTSGHISENISVFQKIIEKETSQLVYKYENGSYNNLIYLLTDSVVEITQRDPHNLVAEVYSHNEDLGKSLIKKIESHYKPVEKKGHVFSLVKNGSHLSLTSIGNAGVPFQKMNYSEKVVTVYEDIVNDLNSESPSGRIVIFEGEPGTGKTHLIKSLLLEVPNAMFVLIPPDMVASLAGPEILPCLLQNKLSYASKGPIIIVLEDADQCLVTRSGENINSIQALLNLSDGILGSVLDLRIVATTNANKLQMEEAILRPGRLSHRVEVDALSAKEANALLKYLVPNYNQTTDELMTLAKTYQIARKAGWRPVKNK